MTRPLLISLTLLGLFDGCSAEQSKATLRLAVTTSTRDSGLLDQVLPIFEKAQSARVDVIAVGTGAALKLGAAGDVDALICHAEAAELEFMTAGHGTRREPIMENSFLILGPASDPASIKEQTPADGLSAIRKANQIFVSRGDESGTHKCELRTWAKAGGLKPWAEYHETGQGMGQTLIVADQMQGYVLCDHGTYLKFRSKIELRPLIRSGEGLENPYAVIVVNPDKHRNVNASLANAFVDFLISEKTQSLIGDYRVDGEPLFRPLRKELVN